MRHSSYIPLMDLELTEEEIAYLQPQAAAIYEPFVKATKYDPIKAHKRETFSEFLQRAEVIKVLDEDPVKVLSMQVIHGIANPSPLATMGKIRTIETQVDTESGLGIKHSSYGGIKVSAPTGAGALLVGSASLGNRCVNINFSTGRVSVDDDRSPHIYSGNRTLLELVLSIEQYCMFIRGNKGIQTPCGIGRTGVWADDAPALTHVQTSQRDLKREIRQAAQPMALKIKELVELLKQGASKKSEYADLVNAAEQANSAFKAVSEEVSSIVKIAGMKEGQVAQRQFEADLADRLGQLKLGNSLNTLLRGLGHDTGAEDVEHG